MPQFDPYTSSSIPSDHKNKVEAAKSKTPAPIALQKPAEPEPAPAECDICECCRANTSRHAQRPSTCASPASTCCGVSCPDLDPARVEANTLLHSPATFHTRHARLRLQQQTLISSTGESFSETRLSPLEQARDLPELHRSQQEDDAIRLTLAAERAEAEGVGGDEPVPEATKNETEISNGD